jgi:hypothetical protein
MEFAPEPSWKPGMTKCSSKAIFMTYSRSDSLAPPDAFISDQSLPPPKLRLDDGGGRD